MRPSKLGLPHYILLEASAKQRTLRRLLFSSRVMTQAGYLEQSCRLMVSLSSYCPGVCRTIGLLKARLLHCPVVIYTHHVSYACTLGILISFIGWSVLKHTLRGMCPLPSHVCILKRQCPLQSIFSIFKEILASSEFYVSLLAPLDLINTSESV